MVAIIVPGRNGPIIAGGTAGGGAQSTVYDVNLTSGNDGSYETYTVVAFMAAANISAPTGTPTEFRVTLRFSANAAGEVCTVYAGRGASSGNAYSFASASPTHVTFSGGDITTDGSTLEYVSDWCALPESFDETKPFNVATQFVGGHLIGFKFVSSTGDGLYYKVAAEASTQVKSGYTLNAADTAEFVSKLETR